MADRELVVTLYRDKTSGTLHTDAPLGENWRESFDAAEYVPKQELTQAEEDIKRLKGEKGVLRIRKDDAEARERRAEERARVLVEALRVERDAWQTSAGRRHELDAILATFDSSTGSR